MFLMWRYATSTSHHSLVTGANYCECRPYHTLSMERTLSEDPCIWSAVVPGNISFKSSTSVNSQLLFFQGAGKSLLMTHLWENMFVIRSWYVQMFLYETLWVLFLLKTIHSLVYLLLFSFFFSGCQLKKFNRCRFLFRLHKLFAQRADGEVFNRVCRYICPFLWVGAFSLRRWQQKQRLIQ